MGAALLIARSRLRANLTATVLLVLLAGIGGGVVMASIAGIRRADASWTRLQEENPAGDAGVVILGPDGEPVPSTEDDQQDEIEAVSAMDGVAAVSRATTTVGTIDDRDGTSFPIAANVYLDDPVPALLGRPIIVAGALPDPDAADEVVVNELLADRLDAGVGDHLTLTPFLYDELEAASDGRDDDPGGQVADLRIAAIVRQADDLLPPRTDQFALYADEPFVLLTPAWWRANGPDVANFGVFMLVDLMPGADFTDFEASMAERFGESALVIPGIEELGAPAEVKRAVDRQIDAEGRAVAAFGVAVALAALGILVLALARQLAAEGRDRDDLLALGITTRSLLLVSVLRSGVVALGAGIVALGVAMGLSARLPVGVGRRTMRDTGLHVDGAVLVLGSLVVMVVVVALVALVGWRVDRRSPERRPRSVFANRLATAGAPPTATVGVHLALEGSTAGRPARTAITVAGVAVAVTVAAAVLVASLHDLRTDPAEMGQAWDASAGNFATPKGLEKGKALVDEIDGIDAVAGEMQEGATIDGHTVTGVAHLAIQGEIAPRLEEGRPPATADEVVLGATLARELGVTVGNRVPVELQFLSEPIELEVVGIGPVGAMGFDTDPGRSMLIHSDLAEQDEEAGVQVLLLRFDEGADRDAVIAALRDQFPLTVLVAPVPPRSVQTFSGLTVLPVALAVTVALLALAASANGAVASVRRRRRDLAVLKVLGMGKGQVRGVVHVQSMTWAVVALLLGVPAGIVLGSIGWRQVGRSLGLETPLTIPAPVLVAVVVGVPVILLALTWWPARQAAATAPAVTLRSE